MANKPKVELKKFQRYIEGVKVVVEAKDLEAADKEFEIYERKRKPETVAELQLAESEEN